MPGEIADLKIDVCATRVCGEDLRQNLSLVARGEIDHSDNPVMRHPSQHAELTKIFVESQKNPLFRLSELKNTFVCRSRVVGPDPENIVVSSF